MLDTKLLLFSLSLVVAVLLMGTSHHIFPGSSVCAFTIRSHWKWLDKQVIRCLFIRLGPRIFRWVASPQAFFTNKNNKGSFDKCIGTDTLWNLQWKRKINMWQWETTYHLSIYSLRIIRNLSQQLDGIHHIFHLTKAGVHLSCVQGSLRRKTSQQLLRLLCLTQMSVWAAG